MTLSPMARQLGVPVTCVMPHIAPLTKVSLGLGRIVALYYRSSTLHRNR